MGENQKKLPEQKHFNYLWSVTFFIRIMLLIITGIIISEVALPAMGIPIVADPFWSTIHDSSSNLFLLLLRINLAMHWD